MVFQREVFLHGCTAVGNKGSLPHAKEAVESVILRKKHGRHRAVSFGDEPELHPGGGVIDRQEPAPTRDRTVICLPVVIVHFAPFAGLMPLNCEQDVVVRNVIEDVGRGDNPAQSEPGNRLCIRTPNR